MFWKVKNCSNSSLSEFNLKASRAANNGLRPRIEEAYVRSLKRLFSCYSFQSAQLKFFCWYLTLICSYKNYLLVRRKINPLYCHNFIYLTMKLDYFGRRGIFNINVEVFFQENLIYFQLMIECDGGGKIFPSLGKCFLFNGIIPFHSIHTCQDKYICFHSIIVNHLICDSWYRSVEINFHHFLPSVLQETPINYVFKTNGNAYRSWTN